MEETWLAKWIEEAKKCGAKTAIDVGANVGEWTELLLEHFDQVVAVEPDPRAFARLSAMSSSRLLCINAAVTDRMGAVDFHLRPESVQSSLLEEHPIGGGDQREAPILETIGVNGVTLDFALFQAAQKFGDLGTLFVKVDVEGAEGSVLAGAKNPAFRAAAWLIEVHDRRVEVGTGLQALGYDGISIIPHPFESAHPEHGWVYTEPGYSET